MTPSTPKVDAAKVLSIGPKIVCAGCGEECSVFSPLCPECAKAYEAAMQSGYEAGMAREAADCAFANEMKIDAFVIKLMQENHIL